MHKKMMLVFTIFLFLVFQATAADDVNDIIKNVQKTYDKMENLTASFRQVDTFSITGSVSEASGRIFIKDKVKYRFESDDQIIVTDGKTIWTFNNMTQQLLIDNVRKNSGALLPRDLLFEYPKNYIATLLGEQKVDGDKAYNIRMDPKENIHGYVKFMKLWIQKNSWHIIKIETTDLNGNVSTFEISDIDAKSKLTDQMFRFQETDKMQVVDMR